MILGIPGLQAGEDVKINTCSIKPVELYISTLSILLEDLEANSSDVDLNNPLFKNTADVVMNRVLNMHYTCRILGDAPKEAILAFATWTNPMYLISN